MFALPDSDRSDPFVGREHELGVLENALALVREGRPHVVLVQGPPGMGKTALVRRFLAGASGVHTAWVTGDESETRLEFGVVDRLARSGSALSPPSRARGSDPLTVGAELLEWLAGRAERGTLVLVVDDAPWADASSLHALAFAIRRLVDERVLAILTARDGDLSGLPSSLRRIFSADGDRSLTLGGLRDVELVALAASMGMPGFPLAAARRLVNHTGGNPLYARALLRELDPAVWSAAGVAPLPAPASFAALIRERLERCGPAARELVAAGAVLGMAWLAGQAAAVAGIADFGPALDEAVSAGFVLALGPGGEVRFAHPLIRAAVYHHVPPASRASVHLAAAAQVDGHERLRHRAAAALAPDPGLATELAECAATEAARGSWAAAADAYLTAARLASGPQADGHLLSALECLVLGGDTVRAEALRPRAQAAPRCAQRDYVLGLIASSAGDRTTGVRLFERAWTSRGPGDGEIAAKAAAQLAMAASNSDRAPEVLRWVQRALEGPLPAPLVPVARLMEAMGLGESGRYAAGLAAMAEPSPETDRDALAAQAGRGVLLLWSERPGEALAELVRADEVAQRVGPMLLRIVILLYRADAEYRLGRWDEALVHAELAASLAHDAGEVWSVAMPHAVAAFPAASRGEWDRAEAHIEAASEVARMLGDPANRLWVATARARLGQARGDPGEMLAATDEIVALTTSYGRHEPGIQPWALLRADALVGARRLSEAAELLDQVERRVGRRRFNRTSQLTTARIRARLLAADGRRDEAEAGLAAALHGAVHQEIAALERAQAHGERGVLLRRLGRRRAAIDELATARDQLARLGAVPFLTAIDRELAACGVARSRPRHGCEGTLTPQEQAVATLVATGLTNRQVAERLVLSTKGVEYHLGHVFAKLGVANRTELAARLTTSPLMREE